MDGGKSWTELRTGLDYSFNAIDFFNENTGFIAGESGTLLKTIDGGKSWWRLNTGGHKGTIFGLKIIPPGKIVACGAMGNILISWDGGQTWMKINSGIKEPVFNIAFSGNDIAIAGKTGTMLLSNNGGRSFAVKIDENLNSLSGVSSHPAGGFMFAGEFGTILKVETLKQ
jgi:photosystem II stability/assembly factor-like uncharacterized protein